jgi:hypothetical protein
MFSDAALTAAETAIRNAIVSDSFADATALLGRYGSEIEQLARSLPPESEAARALRARAFDLFGWTRTMALAAREYAAVELDHLQSVSRYHDPSGPSPRVRADA